MSQKWVIAFTAIWLGLGAFGAAQDRATVQMRDGSKFEGRIEELTAKGELFVRVSQHDQRRVPISSVALIDKVGGATGLPDTELREAAGSQHLMLLSNGSSVKGQLVAIRGGEGSANGNEPRTYVFRTGGGDQTYGASQVSRIYLGGYPSALGSSSNVDTSSNTSTALDPGIDAPGSFRVPARSGWVNTGIRVRRGQQVGFTTTGEVQLSSNSNDRARSAGTPRTSPGALLPSVNVGGLIGRVGNSQPFGIGDQTLVPMPFDGILFLAVNDDERSDNAGEFVVSIDRSRR